MSIKCFSILTHRQSSFANEIADRQFLWLFGTSFVQRNHGFSIINIFHSVVEITHIITFVRKKGTLPDRQDLVGGKKNNLSQEKRLPHWQGASVHKGAGWKCSLPARGFCSPSRLIAALIVLVGGRMDAQSAVDVAVGLVFRIEFVLGKGFWVVLLGIRQNRRGIQPDKGCVHDAQFIELPY